MSLFPGSTDGLQFESVVPKAVPQRATPADGSSDARPSVTCARCGETIVDAYYSVDAADACERCKDAQLLAAAPPRGMLPFGRALIFGMGAAIAGAVLYYAVVAITDFEIGIVAIAIGYMVGYAIRRALAGRGGRRYQVLAILLTYWAVGLAYTPLALKQSVAERDKAATETAQTAAASNDSSSGASTLALAVAVVAALTLVLPAMVILGSLPSGAISALIIGVGMRQAWRMTAAAAPVVSGPYRIASTPPSAG